MASADDVFERHGLAGQFRVDRSTQKAVAKVDPHLGQVPRVVPNEDVLADIRREGDIEIANPRK